MHGYMYTYMYVYIYTLPNGVWFTSMTRLVAKPNHNYQPYECQANWLQVVTFLCGLHTQLLHQLGLHTLTHAHMHAHTWIHIETAQSKHM